ncbi:MAG: hypothetical protein MRZ37_03850 [Tenericutes bacterium]|nr:hypothetical protein [Mycoplasmatota bacterium]
MGERKVYIPSMNEISTMQSIVNDNTIGSRGSVYNYCLAKRIEYIVFNGGLECVSDEIRNDREIAKKVLRFCPNDLIFYYNDFELAKEVIGNIYHNDVRSGIDYINLTSCRMQNSPEFVHYIVTYLAEYLNKYPDYRFNYVDNKLLNTLFSGNILDNFDINGLSYRKRVEFFEALSMIEPAYILKTDKKYYDHYRVFVDEMIDTCYANHLVNSIIAYANRYGISSINNNVDILNSNNDNCKKLVKFLKERK